MVLYLASDGSSWPPTPNPVETKEAGAQARSSEAEGSRGVIVGRKEKWLKGEDGDGPKEGKDGDKTWGGWDGKGGEIVMGKRRRREGG